MRGLPHYDLPDIEVCLAANLQTARLTNPDVQAVGIALNTSKMDRAEAEKLCADISARTGLPCTDPVAFGVGPIVDRIVECFAPAASSPAISA